MHTYRTCRYEVLTKIPSCPGSLHNKVEISLEKNQPIENVIITFSKARFKVCLVLGKWLAIHLRQVTLWKVKGCHWESRAEPGRTFYGSRSFILCCFLILHSTPISPGQSDEHLRWMFICWMLAILNIENSALFWSE